MERAVSGVRTGQNGSAGDRKHHDREEDLPMENAEPPTPQSLKHQCPSCGSFNVHRSHRGLWERYILSPLRPSERFFRCHACRHRFWASTVPPPLALRTSSVAERPISDNGKKKRKGRSSAHNPSFRHRFENWLYRKHGVNMQTLAFASVAFFIILYFLYWVIGEV